MGFATTALVLSLAGTGLSAWGQWRAGKEAKKVGEAQRDAAESSAGLSDYNANVAELQAADAVDRGEEAEQQYRSTIRRTVATQRVGFAASNIDVGFGSALDVQADVAYLGELDALTIRTNAAREAWGYQVQAQDNRLRGDIQRREGVMLEAAGRSNQTAARLGAVGTVVGGTGSLLAQRYGFGRA